MLVWRGNHFQIEGVVQIGRGFLGSSVMSSEEMDMAAPVEAGGSEGVVAEEVNDVAAAVDERVVKSEPALDELNRKVSHDVEKSEEVEGKVSDESVNESVDTTVEAPLSVSAEEPLEVDAEFNPLNHIQDAAEITEGEELSEAIEIAVLDDEESLKPKISEDVPAPVSDNSVECVDSVVDSATTAEPLEDSVVVGPVSTSNDVEDEPKHSEDALEPHSVVSSEIGDNEGVRAESSGENLLENTDGDTVDDVGEEDKEVVEATTSEDLIEENSEGVETVPSDDIEMKVPDVNSEDLSETNATSESPDNAKERAEIIGEETPATVSTVSTDAVDPYVEEGEETVEATTGKDLKEEVSAEVKSVPPPSDDVADNSVEVNSEDLSEVAAEMPSKSTDCEDVGAKVLSEESADVVDNEPVEAPGEEAVEAAPSAEPMVESPSSTSVSAPPDEVGVKDVEVNYEEAAPSAEPIVESPSSEAACASPDDVEVKDVEVNFEVASGMTTTLETADREYVRPGISAQESDGKVDSEAVDATVEEVEKDNEYTEVTTNGDPDEKPVSVELELAPSDIVDDKSVGESPESAGEVRTSKGAGNEDLSPALPAEGSVDIVDSESIDAQVDEKEVVGETTNTEPEEELVEAGPVPSPSDHVEDEAIEADFEDESDLTTTLISADSEDTIAGASADSVDSEAVDALVEESTEVADAATNMKTDEDLASTEFRTVPDDAISITEEVKSEVSAPEMDDENINATFAPLPVEEDIFDLNEYLLSTLEHEGISDDSPKQNGLDMAADVKEIVDAEYSQVSSQVASSADFLEEADDVSSERHHQNSGLAEEEIVQTDRSSHEEELPQESDADPPSEKSVLVDAEVNAKDAKSVAEGKDFINEERPDTQSEEFPESSVIPSPEEILRSPVVLASKDRSDEFAEPCDEHPLAEEVEHPTTKASIVPSSIGVERKELPSIESVDDDGTDVAPKDVSRLLQTEMTDDEVKSAVIHVPEEYVEVEPSLLLADALGVPHSKEVESILREINLNDFSEAPTTNKILRGEPSVDSDGGMISDEVVTPLSVTSLGTANGEKEQSLDTAGNESEVASKSSYNHPDLDEVAAKLHHVAEDIMLSDNGEARGSVSQSVAQIVLDESSRAADSAEYITGVVQHVAQFAQDASRANLNMLSETVARGFVDDTTDSPADRPVSQPQVSFSIPEICSTCWCWLSPIMIHELRILIFFDTCFHTSSHGFV